MQKILLIVVLAIVLGVAFYFTSKITEAPTVEPTPQESGDEETARGEMDLRITTGETKSALGLSITLNGVPNDYRCPVDVVCIQGGAIVANVTFATASKSETFNMPSDEVPREWNGYRVSIVTTEPDALSQTTIPKEDYVVTFKVVKDAGQ